MIFFLLALLFVMAPLLDRLTMIADVFAARAPAISAGQLATADKGGLRDQGAAALDRPRGQIDYAPAYFALTPDMPVYRAGRRDPDTAAFLRITDDPNAGLPTTDGVDLVAGYCGSCHSLQIVTQQRLTKNRWDRLLDWMVEKQGMAPPPADDRAIILAYLAREFPSVP